VLILFTEQLFVRKRFKAKIQVKMERNIKKKFNFCFTAPGVSRAQAHQAPPVRPGAYEGGSGGQEPRQEEEEGGGGSTVK